MIWRSAHAIQRHLEEVSRALTAMRLPNMADAGSHATSVHHHGREPLIPVRLPENASVIGKRLAELDLPAGAAVVALSRNGSVIVPEENEVLRAGDTLALVGSREALETALALCQAPAGELQSSA
jgi:CPA2 family monovalent cation:H+ antiporter-2